MFKIFSQQRLFHFILPGLLLALPVAAEPAQESTFSETVEVSEVLLDVLVTDRDGNVVLGLEPADFVIQDEGQELAPNSLSFYSNRFELDEGRLEEIQHPAEGEILADRYFLFVFHDPRAYGAGGRLLRQHLEATRRAREWVDSQMLPGDWVAVLSYDYKLKVHQDFTQDPDSIDQAIDRAATGKDPANEWESRREDITEGIPSLLPYLPSGKDLRKETTRIYDALRLVADATHGILGRKNMLLFTIGFGDIQQTGGLSSEPDRRYYPAMEQALNDNNVAIYPINLMPGNRNLQGHFLSRLANDTGGTYYETFVNFITPMKQVADESNGYYLLSYQAAHPTGETGYRDVKVSTRNPEFRVKARRGYRFGS